MARRFLKVPRCSPQEFESVYIIMAIISILDYGCGNSQSIIRMLERVGVSAKLVREEAEIRASQALVLPGVGAFDHGIGRLREQHLENVLHDLANVERIPILGICLGMQLMCRGSEEGGHEGLGWFDAWVKRFPDPQQMRLPVPHMGWNTLSIMKQNPLLLEERDPQRFYFAHSYRIFCNDPSDVVATSSYGENFVAAFHRDNLFGVQFHPEKSHRYGLALMAHFKEWVDAKA